MDNTDKHAVLPEEPFAYEKTKNGRVFISWRGKQVTVLQGGSAERFLGRIEAAEGVEKQLIMAKITGNFKRGNEKVHK